MKKLLIAIPSNTGRDSYPVPFANSLILNCRNVPKEYDLDIHTFGGLRIDMERCQAAIYAQQHHFDAMIFLDDDMIFPSDMFMKLIAHWESGLKVISGLYGSKSYPFHLFIRPDIKKDWLRKCDPILYQTQAIATGALLIDMKVFDLIKKPWFLLRCDQNMEKLITTEDCFFGLRCNDAEIPMYVDASIQCQHLRLCAFPNFFNHPNVHYDGEYLDKVYPQCEQKSVGPLVMTPMEGTNVSDGIMLCRHDHQQAFQMNDGQEQLYRCLDCGLVSKGPDYAGCNLLDPRVMNAKEIEKELKSLENTKY